MEPEKQSNFIEVNGKACQIFVEEKDIKASYARFLNDKLCIVISSRLSDEDKQRAIEYFKKRMQKPTQMHRG
ncbi:MAG: hypothetical protein HY514_04995 [Candidatus Aenigmarchaeota archaeon]|nr:hypothetical protein [Candidatus Aenigmarchaeota archaeon]